MVTFKRLLRKFSLILLLISIVSVFELQNYSYSTPNNDMVCYLNELEYHIRMMDKPIVYDNVSCTYYNPTIAQTDSTPLLTGSGSVIDTIKLKDKKIRWVACSWDLLTFGGGELKYNDTIEVTSADNKRLNGYWIVKDATNPKITKHIDFLCYGKIDGKFNLISIKKVTGKLRKVNNRI